MIIDITILLVGFAGGYFCSWKFGAKVAAKEQTIVTAAGSLESDIKKL